MSELGIAGDSGRGDPALCFLGWVASCPPQGRVEVLTRAREGELTWKRRLCNLIGLGGSYCSGHSLVWWPLLSPKERLVLRAERCVKTGRGRWCLPEPASDSGCWEPPGAGGGEEGPDGRRALQSCLGVGAQCPWPSGLGSAVGAGKPTEHGTEDRRPVKGGGQWGSLRTVPVPSDRPWTPAWPLNSHPLRTPRFLGQGSGHAGLCCWGCGRELGELAPPAPVRGSPGQSFVAVTRFSSVLVLGAGPLWVLAMKGSPPGLGLLLHEGHQGW